MRRILVLVALLLTAALVLPETGAAYNWYYALVQARYPLTERTRSCVVCHTRAGTTNLNPYGAAFLAEGADARALSAIAGRDSDEDGTSNEIELRTGHFPGEVIDIPTSAEIAARRAGRPVPRDLEREIFETLQCPCCDKLVMNCHCDMVPEVRRIVREGVAAGRGAPAIKATLVAKFGRMILPLDERTRTLPASRFPDRRVANAYRIAADLPRELEKYPCFCACYRANGHESLLDCFKNEHGASCETCIEEAEVIEAMVRDRKSEAEIRERILTRFRGRR